ncbi:MAG: Gfo/Idh/MocA family oxidoreductase [Planctomycetaceae bacterium]
MFKVTSSLSRCFPAALCFVAAMALVAADGAPKKPTKKQADTPEVKRIEHFSKFSDWVTSLAYSPDGKLIAAGTFEQVQLLNPADKKAAVKLTVDSYVKSVAFSPDGKLLASGSYQAATLWDVATHKPVKTFDAHGGYVTGVRFSPDGKLLATCSDDQSIRLWNVENGEPGYVMTGHAYPVQGIAFSPDGKRIASAAGDPSRVTQPGEVKIWSVATGKVELTLPPPRKAATDVAFSPDGKLLASTSQDEKVNVYDAVTGKAIGYFDGHSRATNCVLFAPDGKTVISASGGRAKGFNEVKFWEPMSGDVKATIAGHELPVSALALSPDGKTLATGSHDKSVALWDVGPILSQSEDRPVDAPKPTASRAADRKSIDVQLVSDNSAKPLRVGIIGLDTSHAIAFTKDLNAKDPTPDIANCRVVAVYPRGSADIESSVSRVPEYTKQIKEMGVEVVDSIDALLEKVDAVLLETNDGRPHLEQALPVFKAGKPVFIDKPIAGSLTDAVVIFEAAKKYNVPVFSSSSLRFGKGTQAVRGGSIGKVNRCETHSPCSLEPTHPDLFWYGIHGVESLFTVMGTGCHSVWRTESTSDHDFVEGQWKGGRLGIFRGYREGGKGGYGGTATGAKGTAEVGSYDGYRPLVVEIVKFFRTGKPPVSAEETLEIYAFMEAADESKRQNGAEVTLESVMKKARAEAEMKIAELAR